MKHDDLNYKLNEDFSYHQMSSDKGILIKDNYHFIVNGLISNDVLHHLALEKKYKDVNNPLYFYTINKLENLGVISSRVENISNETRLNHLQFIEDINIFKSNINLHTSLIKFCEDKNIACLVTSSYLHPKIQESIANQRERVVCLVKIIGENIWIGPFLPANSDLWSSLFQRLRDNFPTENFIAVKKGCSPTTSRKNSREQEKAAFKLILQEISRHFNVKEYDKPKIKIYDEMGNFLNHHLLLTQCSKIDLNKQLIGNIKSKDGGYRTITPKDLIELSKTIIDPILGIIPGLTHVQELNGAHVVTTTQIIPNAHLLKENRRIGSKLSAAGKGESIDQARASCIGEAIERYSASYQGNEPSVIGSFSEFSSQAFMPNEIMLYSEKQYNNRSWWNDNHGFFHYVPEVYEPSEKIHWSICKTIHGNYERLIPTSFLYFNFYQSHALEKIISVADSNGCASGSTLLEAQCQAIYELIERDACSIWWYNKLKMPEIEISQFKSKFIQNAKKRYETYGRFLKVLDITTDIKIPVAIAISFKFDGSSICVGLGCHLDMQIAVSRAISELDQFVAMFGLEIINNGNSSGNTELDSWLLNEKVSDHPYLIPSLSKVIDYAKPSVKSTVDEIDLLVSIIEKKLTSVYFSDLSRPETPLYTVKVIIPGLRHFWARFAPGRLYDVPVSLGHLKQPLEEKDLNPIPFFL